MPAGMQVSKLCSAAGVTHSPSSDVWASQQAAGARDGRWLAFNFKPIPVALPWQDATGQRSLADVNMDQRRHASSRQ